MQHLQVFGNREDAYKIGEERMWLILSLLRKLSWNFRRFPGENESFSIILNQYDSLFMLNHIYKSLNSKNKYAPPEIEQHKAEMVIGNMLPIRMKPRTDSLDS